MDKSEARELLYNNPNTLDEQYETDFDNAVIIIQNTRILKELKEFARNQLVKDLYRPR